jgi:hypothetical protein
MEEGMTVHMETTAARSRSDAAVLILGGTKVYGEGATEVRALDDVTLDFARC